MTQKTCARCNTVWDSDKDWPVQVCKTCWKAGWSVRKDGNVYQKKDAAAELFTKPAKPAVVAAPAPIGNQAPDQRVALARAFAGGPGPNPGKANAGATISPRDTLYDECLIMLDNIASNVLTIKAKLAELSKK
jgi:hypothetical protein